MTFSEKELVELWEQIGDSVNMLRKDYPQLETERRMLLKMSVLIENALKHN